jgi:hypothetical protein
VNFIFRPFFVLPSSEREKVIYILVGEFVVGDIENVENFKKAYKHWGLSFLFFHIAIWKKSLFGKRNFQHSYQHQNNIILSTFQHFYMNKVIPLFL